MASLAVGKIIRAKCPLAVVASAAAARLRRGEMHGDGRLGHLPAPWSSRADGVASSAIHFAAGEMFRMVEALAIRNRPLGRPHKAALLMANIAGSHRHRSA